MREKKETVTVALVVSIPEECHRRRENFMWSTDATFFRVMHFVLSEGPSGGGDSCVRGPECECQ